MNDVCIKCRHAHTGETYCLAPIAEEPLETWCACTGQTQGDQS